MPWRKELSTASPKISRNVPILEKRKQPTPFLIGTGLRDKLQICCARYSHLNLSQHVSMVKPSTFMMRGLKRGLRQGEFLEKSSRSNRGDSYYKPATGI